MKLKQLLIMLFVVPSAIAQSRTEAPPSLFAPESAATLRLPQSTSTDWASFCVSSACGTEGTFRSLPSSSTQTGAPSDKAGRSFEVGLFDYPAISSGAWALLPDFSYRLTLSDSADTPRQSRLSALPNLPIATAWFGLGSLLSCLALQRKRYQTSRGR